MEINFETQSPRETIALGKLVGERLRGGEIIAYKGDLGAGKTTMTRGISLGMGLGDEVTSPTFALVNEYRKTDSKLSLIHFDMYRISGYEDLETTGFFDYADEDSVLCVEWSENIEEALEESCIVIAIRHLGDDRQRISIITADGDDRFEDIGDRYKR